METSKEYRNISKKTYTVVPANEADYKMTVLTENIDNLKDCSITVSEIDEKHSRTKDESELEMNGHFRIDADLEQITVVKNDYESDQVTSGDSDSGQNLRIKTENETQQDTGQTYANQDEYPQKLCIKKEHKRNDYPETDNCNAASEFPTKCQSCECCFTEYLHYLDHRSLCVPRKDNDNTFEVKIETDEIPELYSDNMLQSGKHLKGHETLPEAKQEVNETSYENDKNTMAPEQDNPINHHNIPAQPVPQLLVQNTASGTDTLPSEKQGQEIPITCFYCNEAFLHMDRLSYIQHMDRLSDIQHMDRSSYVQHMQKHLDKMNKVNKGAKFDAGHEVKSLNDYLRNLFTVEITATVCKHQSCNYIFVDNSVYVKHDLMTHRGYQFVCSKVDCHRVFPDKSSLRSHEIDDHTRIVRVYPSKTADSVKMTSYSCTKSEFFDIISSTKAKPVRYIIKKNAKNACGACGKEFSTSAELTSHIIYGHPVIAKQFENLHRRGTVNEVAKGEKEVIRTKIKISEKCSQTETNCSACENVECNCFTGISQNQESCEASFVDLSTFRDRGLSKRSRNSIYSAKETAGDVCREGKHMKTKNEQTLEYNRDSSINVGEDIYVTGIDKQERADNKTDRKKCSVKRQSNTSFKRESSEKVRKLDSTELYVNGNKHLMKPENKEIKLDESDFLLKLSDKSEQQGKIVSESDTDMTCKMKQTKRAEPRHRNRNHSIDLNILAGFQTAKGNQMKIPSAMDKTVREILENSDDNKEVTNDMLDAAKYTSDIIDTDSSILDIAKTGIQLGKVFSMNLVQKHSTASEGYDKGTDSIRMADVFKDKNENDKNIVQQQNLMLETTFNRSNENEEISTGKDSHTKGIYRYPCNLNNCQLVFTTSEKRIEHVSKQHLSNVYPCMAEGCKMVFDTNDERRKHVQEQHISISFNPSQVDLQYITPGIYKATYRNKKLLKHSSNCSDEGIKKSKITSSDSSKSVPGKPCSKIEAASIESSTAFKNPGRVKADGIKPISKFDERVKGNFRNFNSCQRLKLKQHSVIASNEKKRKSGVVVYGFEDNNKGNKKVKQLERLMRDEHKVEGCGKYEEITAGKYNVTHKFPCNFRGCHLLFNSYKEKMKHLIEQHMKPNKALPELPCMHDGCKMVFDTLKERRKHVYKQHITSNISPIRFNCTTPGCFKGFDRILDLKDHSRNCSNMLNIKSRSHVSK